jgi:hypothetical protein
MNLSPYLDGLRRDLQAAAAPGGAEVVTAADLLAGSLEASARLCLLEALADSAAEITTKLHTASVEVRLHGREVQFVVTEAPGEPTNPPGGPGLTGGPGAPAGQSAETDSADIARITLRMPEWLKVAVERACAAEGISVNAWLVRAITQVIRGGPPNLPPPPPGGHIRSGRRLTGYAQA